MVLLILIMGMLNLYDIVKNVNISIYDIININEKNIIYLLLIFLFFFFIFFHSKHLGSSLEFSLMNSMEFELILGLGLLGLSFFILSNDFFLFFLALELYSLSVYLLLFQNDILKAKITLLYFLLGSISSSLILFGISIMYAYSGSLDMKYIIENINVIMEYHNEESATIKPAIGGVWYLLIGLGLLLIGLLFKLGSAPFQYWVIRVYTQMDLKILIYQSIVPKIAFIFILSNIINYFPKSPLWGSFVSLFLFLLLFSALLSLFIGPIGGLTHGVNKIKMIIAYSSILHVGYLLLGLVSNYYNDILYLNIFQYLLIYGLNTFQFLLAFFFLQYFQHPPVFNFPLLFFYFLISIFSFIGLPPFAGFYAKLNIILNCFYTNNILLQGFAIFFILFSTLIALFLYLKFLNFFYFTPNYFQHPPVFNLLYSKSPWDFSYLLSFFSLFLLFYPFFLPYFSPIYEILSM